MSIKPTKFENIISQEEYSKLNGDQIMDFYSEKGIYIYNNGKIPKYIIQFFDTFKKGFRDLDLLKNNITLNPDLIDEILSEYFKELKFVHNGCNYLKQKLAYNLSYILSEKELLEELKKNYKYYSTNLQELSLAELYLIPNSIDVYDEYLISLLKVDIQCNEKMFRNYIITENKIEFLSFKFFKEYKEALEYTKVLNYIKETWEELQEPLLDKENKYLTLNQSIIMLDELRFMDIEKWENLDTTKKARLISLLLNKDYSNTIKGLSLLDKKEIPKKFKEDREYVLKLIDKTISNL